MTTIDRADSRGWLAANAVCTLAMIVWAMGFPASDRLLADFLPLTLAAFRMGLAALFLLIVWRAVEGMGPMRRAAWGKGLAIGGLGFGLGSAALLTAQSLTDATTVAVACSTLPVSGLALEILFDRRRITPQLFLGVLLSLAGGAVALFTSKGGLNIGLGALMAVLSVVTFAWGSRATVRSLPDLSPLGRTTVTACGAGLATSLLTAGQSLFGAPLPAAAAFGMTNLALLLFSGIISFALSQLLWIISTEKLGIGVAGMHINAAPFYVMVMVYLLGGAWNWPQAGAALIVGLGVLIAQLPTRSSAA